MIKHTHLTYKVWQPQQICLLRVSNVHPQMGSMEQFSIPAMTLLKSRSVCLEHPIPQALRLIHSQYNQDHSPKGFDPLPT